MKASRGWFVAAILALCYGVVTMGWGLFELISGGTTENVVMGVLFLVIGGLAVAWGVVVLRAQLVARRQQARSDRVVG